MAGSICQPCKKALEDEYLTTVGVDRKEHGVVYTQHDSKIDSDLGLRHDGRVDAFCELAETACPEPCSRPASELKRNFAVRAKSRYIDRLRNAIRRNDVQGAGVRSLDADDADTTLGGYAQPDEAVLVKELMDELTELLSRESPEIQRTVELWAEGYSPAEIASLRACPEPAVRKRISRFRAKAKKEFAV